ncbi:MAG: hypothetical protein ACRBF0_09340 [Calditrichia bacterium]
MAESREPGGDKVYEAHLVSAVRDDFQLHTFCIIRVPLWDGASSTHGAWGIPSPHLFIVP